MKEMVGVWLMLSATSAHAGLLVAKGAVATLTVEYDYSAVGAVKDKYDQKEWRVSRKVSLVVQMTADNQQPVSVMRPMEAGQAADLRDKQAHIAGAQQTMAPMMADMQKILARCGDREACIEKAVSQYGMNMTTTPQLLSAQEDIAVAGKQGAPRYQLWKPVSQKGAFLVDELYRAQTSDPLCQGKANMRCSREETRKGGGDIPLPAGARPGASAALLEVDSVQKDLIVTLPTPLMAMGYARQVTSDYPDELSGPSTGVLGGFGEARTSTVVIPADLHAVSGTQTYRLDGVEGEGGTLTVNWRFRMQ